MMIMRSLENARRSSHVDVCGKKYTRDLGIRQFSFAQSVRYAEYWECNIGNVGNIWSVQVPFGAGENYGTGEKSINLASLSFVFAFALFEIRNISKRRLHQF